MVNDFDEELVAPVFTEYGDGDAATEYDEGEPVVDPWLTKGWNKSRNKPGNVCKFLKGIGLCTVFPYGNAYKFVVGGQFYGPFPTQEEAQLAAKSLKP